MTTQKKRSLADLVLLIRALESPVWDDGAICGALTLNGQAQIDLLTAVVADRDNTPCEIQEGDFDAMVPGTVLRLAFSQPRLGLGYLLRDLDELLRHPTACAGCFDLPWYVLAADWFSADKNSALYEKYSAMTMLVNVMVPCADYYDKADARMVLLNGGRVDVPIRYRAKDLESLDCVAVERLVAACSAADGHSEQRKQILATVLREMTEKAREEDRFALLLSSLPDVLQRFNNGYRLFASSFSFEKVRDQLEALRLEYTGKIHKTISDVQGQLLGIPVATIVVATQMKEALVVGSAMWSNIAVLVGSLFFTILLVASILNQFQTLLVIEQEIKRHEAATKQEHADIAARFVDVFTQLNRRIFWQHVILKGVLGVGCFAFLVAVVVFWALTKPALAVFF
jgi:hypothetical protein